MIAASSGAEYSSKIIKAGALLRDTKLLLQQWNLSTDVATNLARIRQENLFGKASRSRVEDILAVFRQRYLKDPELLGALVHLASGRVSPESLDRILYFEAARADLLLHDVVAELLLPWSYRPDPEVRVWEVQSWLAEQVAAGKTEGEWSEPVQRRIAQGLLSTLRDFGILQGSQRKRIASAYLPVDAFAIIAFQLRRGQPAGDRLVHSPEWRMFFLSDLAVERFFLEAHQERLLQYQAPARGHQLTPIVGGQQHLNN